MSKTPHAWRMELTDCIASYMKARFQEEVFSGPHALPDILILFPVLCEVDHISSVISQAYHYPINVRKNWGGTTCNGEAAERYMEVTELSILVTNSNTIHIWYLLDTLSPKRRANVWNCLHLLREPLWESIKASPQAWQMDKSYFHDNAELKGAINLSPAWFQQGHGHSSVLKPQNGFPEASWLLKSRTENTSTREWVNQMTDTNALLSAILHVIHPQMYADGREALICLGKQAEQWADLDMSSILPIWSSTYSSMHPLYDMLVTVGNYPPLDFVIPMLNLQLCYNPGMIIAFSGSALEHGVGAVDW
ncbi:hypothetical protein F5J12DRAFT_930232 [Pisolithus orientalis]|uniref:uncharacterized protein n=1 Tax=Pisolithus orientalis TaxID=936130 RepID=UPI0022256894|nr:uncharacterized protein F5J12DRAFT_930232 [Pisolithus orientalis]KAI5987143.1 hypothetical protein F5J12DRAFT_930232 [Pisolithus orientalis]